MLNGKFVPLLLLLLPLFLIACGSDRREKIAEATPEKYRAVAEEFMNELSGVLVTELRKGGPISAIKVCADTAQYLTREFSRKKGIVVKRVSFRNRNKLNAPDDFETAVLIEFEKMRDQGRLRARTEYFEVIQDDGISTARYMKPIIVRPLCLNCHGKESEIDKSVLSIVNENYKNDLARNYEVGELRGAVSIMRVLD